MALNILSISLHCSIQVWFNKISTKSSNISPNETQKHKNTHHDHFIISFFVSFSFAHNSLSGRHLFSSLCLSDEIKFQAIQFMITSRTHWVFYNSFQSTHLSCINYVCQLCPFFLQRFLHITCFLTSFFASLRFFFVTTKL